jgi:membrane protease YdiL (CAAX protease family)
MIPDDTSGLAPAEDTAPAPPPPAPALHRIPNLGHALLFIAFTGLVLVVFQAVLVFTGRLGPIAQAAELAARHPKLLLAVQAVTYLIALVSAWLFFPTVWRVPFFAGICCNWPTARRQIVRLVPIVLLLGLLAQAATHFITPPKSSPIDAYFTGPLNAWTITLFGTTLAPFFEEVCFRGFLLPAFAIAYDWLALPRTPEARHRWQTTTALSPISLVFSAILSSILFALLHAEQVDRLVPVLLVLCTVSLVLTYVRIKTQSVAASALVHAAYNSFVFLSLLVATGGYRHLDKLKQ